MVEIVQPREAHDRHLGEHPGMTARPHPRQRLIEDLEHRQDCLGTEQPAGGGQVDPHSIPLEEQRRAAADTRHEAIAESREKLLEDATGIGAAGEARVEGSQRRGGIAAGNRPDQRADPLLAAGADDGMDIVDTDRAGARTEELLEERLAVAHAAGGTAGDQFEGAVGDRRPLGGDDLTEAAGDRRGIDGDEVEPLAAGEDRDRELLRLRRAEDELHVPRRFLERLQQRVEGLPREHVDFVNDVDFESSAGGADGDVLPQGADLVDAAVAGGVDLHDIDILPCGDRATVVAVIARLRRGPGRAFEGLGEDPRGARLAHTAGAGEKIGVADAPRFDRPGETASNVLLADQLVEALRPVAAGDDPVGLRGSAAERGGGVSGCGHGIGRR